ncbi:prephenate dehydratase [Deltaproteobacteria bacterium Smac51]|nr:prephenate dehydratase [Deltaproteobacteria bacterium Smac51]
MTDVLKELRGKIDNLDDQILELLQERASTAIEIGRVKKTNSIAVLDRGREKSLLDRLMMKSVDQPLSGEAIREIYTDIIRACRAAQAPIRVAFLGPTGTFSHAAALSQFGALGIFQPVDDLPSIFKEVEEGRADMAVVPFENSVEGIVGQTLDMLGSTKLHARGMVTLKISLSLMSRSLDLSTVKKVASHPQALAQSRGWLSLNLPGVELIAAASTAAAASMATEDGSVAIIGHPVLADFHGLNLVAENIEDQSHNQTCFLVMGHDHAAPTGHDRTLCWFAAPHSSGSLYSCLQPLADSGVNMTRLHSRPSIDQPWEYHFFLELEGHFEEEKPARALSLLEKYSEKYYLLGSYEVNDLISA